MATPKIKMYRLSKGYSTDSDDDIQSVTNDELLPVVDKPTAPEDFYELTGVVQYEKELLIKLNTSVGLLTSLFENDNEKFQIPISLGSRVMVASGYYTPIVLDNVGEEIDSSEYEATPSGIDFSTSPYPSGASIKFYVQGGDNVFITSSDNLYEGSNSAFVSIIYDDGSPVSKDDYSQDSESGTFTFSVIPSGTVSCTYASIQETARLFISEHQNWVPPNLEDETCGHLYMGPDIFQGLYDYSGDDTEDSEGNVITQGEIPEFVESGYSIDFRNGSVTFTSDVNSIDEPVHASYAHLCAIENVTGQELQKIVSPSGELWYQATESNQYPGSVGAMWVSNTNNYIPRNIYVDGESFPSTITVSPYDVLTIKESE